MGTLNMSRSLSADLELEMFEAEALDGTLCKISVSYYCSIYFRLSI